MKYFILLLFLSLSSCSRIATLNQRPHEFGKKGRYFIWIQIAGLTDEQLALFKFNKSDNVEILSLEASKCAGKLWAYNAFTLRPKARDGFMTQLTGSKTIDGSCRDLKQVPLWSYFNKVGFRNLVLEAPGIAQNSFDEYAQCSEYPTFFSGVRLFQMKSAPKNKKTKLFHYQEELPKEDGRYFDKTCKQNDCYVSLLSNVKNIFRKTLSESKDPFSFLIRDFSYAQKVKEKKILEAREIFIELEKIHAFFLNEKQEKNLDLSVLVTSSGAHQWEFPKEGKQWAQFEKTGRFSIFRHQSLVSSAWASGPGSENFCGMFNESEILRRILWREERKVFDLKKFKNFFQ